MLMEKRFQEILRILEEQGTVSVQDLTESLDASEATIRRDLSQLGPDGKVKKDLWRSSQLRDWLSDQGDPGGGTAGTLCGGEEANRKVCRLP